MYTRYLYSESWGRVAFQLATESERDLRCLKRRHMLMSDTVLPCFVQFHGSKFSQIFIVHNSSYYIYIYISNVTHVSYTFSPTKNHHVLLFQPSSATEKRWPVEGPRRPTWWTLPVRPGTSTTDRLALKCSACLGLAQNPNHPGDDPYGSVSKPKVPL